MNETVKAKKSLGQNFLQDKSVLEEILNIAEVKESDSVFEIGPGTGNLTEVLSKTGCQVLALEIDESLLPILQEKFKSFPKVSILSGDILNIHLDKALKEWLGEEKEYKVIANIPYYITAPIIRTLLSLSHQPSSLTLMVQDEVAERLAALPGKMSLLSVMAQYYACVEKKLFVPKEAFEPVPKVDSAIVELVPTRVFSPEEDKKVFRLVKAGFAARRKTLVNNLSSTFSLSKEEVERRLETLGLRKDVRAQALSVRDWEQLTEMWQ